MNGCLRYAPCNRYIVIGFAPMGPLGCGYAFMKLLLTRLFCTLAPRWSGHCVRLLRTVPLQLNMVQRYVMLTLRRHHQRRLPLRPHDQRQKWSHCCGCCTFGGRCRSVQEAGTPALCGTNCRWTGLLRVRRARAGRLHLPHYQPSLAHLLQN